MIFGLFFWCRWNSHPWGGTIAEKTLLPALLAVVLLAAVQRLNPIDPATPSGIAPFTASAHGTSGSLLLWCAYACLLSCLPQLLTNPRSLRRLAWVIVSAGILVTVIAVFQRGSHQRLLYGFRGVSIYTHHAPFGPFYNRNHAASLLLLSLLTGLGVFFSRASSWRSSRGVGALADLAAQQTLLALLLILIGAGIMMSGSRAALHILALSLAVGLTLSALRSSRAARPAFIALVLASAGGYAAALYRNPRYLAPVSRQLFNSSENSWLSRFSLYKSGWLMWRDAPWTGFGLGAFSAAFPPYQEPSIGAVLVEHVHSDWLELLLETGIFGFAACAAGLLFLIGRAIPARSRPLGDEGGARLIWLACAALSFVLHGLVEFSFTTPANALFFLAVLSALGARTVGSGPSPAGPWTRKSGCLLAVAFSAAALRPLAASWPLYQASQSDILSSPAYLALACRLDPRPGTLHRLGAAQFQQAQLTQPLEVALVREAFQSLQRALEAEPHHRDIRSAYGSLLWRLGRAGDARRFL